MDRKFGTAAAEATAAALLALLVYDSRSASDAVRNAMELCAELIIPSLLPFFFISSLVSVVGIPEQLSSSMGKLLSRLLGISPLCAAPFFLGILGGYPIGAAALAELVRNGKLSPREGASLLPFCNNTGPAFIIGAVGAVFSSTALGIMLYAVHITAALAVGLLLSRGGTAPPSGAEAEAYSGSGLITALPACVKASVEKCIGVCGFIIFFSVLRSLSETLGLISGITLGLSRITGLEIGFCRCLVEGILELGSGTASLRGLEAQPENLALAAFILGFGSLSVHCQTLAMVAPANIKCARHFVGRLIHGIISAALAYGAALVFRI